MDDDNPWGQSPAEKADMEYTVNNPEWLARWLVVELAAHRNREPKRFADALAIALGVLIPQDQLQSLPESIEQWAESSDRLIAESSAYGEAISDAMYRQRFSGGPRMTYLSPGQEPTPASTKKGRQ